MKRKISLISLVLALLFAVFCFTGCFGEEKKEEVSSAPTSTATATKEQSTSTPAPTDTSSPSNDVTEEPTNEVINTNTSIRMIAKGYQHPFWQMVMAGANDAVDELGITDFKFTGPEGENAASDQVELLNRALLDNPDVVIISALDSSGIASALEESDVETVIGLDSGVADYSSLASTVGIDNSKVGALAAENIISALGDRVSSANEENPLVFGILSPDASPAVLEREEGFITQAQEMLGAVSVEGSVTNDETAAGATALIRVFTAADSNEESVGTKAQECLSSGLSGLFCTSESAVTGLLRVSNDGADLGDLVVVGYGAGSLQKGAVAAGYLLGSITRDPYQMGYQAIITASDAVNGVSVADVDSGEIWYTAENISDPAIANLLYD